DRLRPADVQRTALDLALEVADLGRRPAALAAHLRPHRDPAAARDLTRLRVGFRDEAGGMHGDRLVLAPELVLRAVEEIDVRREALGRAADDREEEAESVPRGADDRLRTAADADPCTQAGLGRR